MESTGKYWIPVFNILEEACNICLAHPKYVKAIRRKKTDKKDAQWIADLFKHDLVASSFIPPLKIRQLRDLFRYRMRCGRENTVTADLQIFIPAISPHGRAVQRLPMSVTVDGYADHRQQHKAENDFAKEHHEDAES